MNRTLKGLLAAAVASAALLIPAPANAAAHSAWWGEVRCLPGAGCSVIQFRKCRLVATQYGRAEQCTKWRTPRYAR